MIRAYINATTKAVTRAVIPGSGLNQIWQQFAPTENNGVYIQKTNTVGSYNVFLPVGVVGDVACFEIVKSVSTTLARSGYGILKGYKIVNPTTITGSFGTYSLSSYTTTVNDSISLTFTGTSIYFRSVIDNRGGMWRFNIDGGANIDISVYTSGSLARVSQLIASGLTYGSHTIVGTFIGQDPAHPIESPRGWICLDETTSGENYYQKAFWCQDYKDFNFVHHNIAPTYANECGSLIEDFAFKIKKKDSAVASHWIPDHDANATMTPSNKKLYLDGVELDTTTNTSAFATKHNTILVDNDMVGFNYAEPAENLISIDQTISYDYRGVTVNHTIVALQDLDVADAYISMQKMTHASFDNAIINGVEYPTVLSDGSSASVSAGSSFKSIINTLKSGSGEAMNVVSGMQLLTGISSFNLSDGLTKLTKIVFTDAKNHKLYLEVAKDQVMPSGTSYTFSSIYFINKITGAYTYAASKLL